MSLYLGQRNRNGLTDRQIEYCIEAWQVLCGDEDRILITDEANINSSRTRFVEDRNVVDLGADAYPGNNSSANSRMSVLACLAHELSHMQRFDREYRRPLDMPDILIDEAETSLNASFHIALGSKDREDLIEDARDRLIEWLDNQSQSRE
ncbi:hypothetical protein VB638_11955 [Dolichospermum sp. UHCC 0684]|jgi:hypothetical protein|uniref:hypothetical protein n=1 Tax=Nostocales TaxID=1161 RepID=UPI00029B5FE1|nr:MULTISPECIES: hypothetical protein [Nostocales]MBO1054628.1 hypothetical protein [Dolichospermum sp. DET73]AFW93718.1 hypothetical protein ANA_C10926 [Anabaena sp. 90]MEA5530288.1 hypothetical protein [Dolichospermum sp. UHCC 0684]MTJ19666.1 hypothetical protein [Dolichospermum sp. UHCC 0299]MTJ22108.1 hypothetical protein [Dolichospermum sp. UHCC 0352]